MDMTGEYIIPAPREVVWRGLNDPAVLARAIPGCESLERDGETGFTARVAARIGPVRAKFTGKVTLSDIEPPRAYTLTGEGKAPAAGFARGSARVELAETDDGQTRLTYTVTSSVGGKLAQIGSRLVDSAAAKMANEFFQSFSDVVGGDHAESETAATVGEPVPPRAAAPTAPPPHVPEPDHLVPPPISLSSRRSLSPRVWIGLLIGLVIAILVVVALSANG
ncbi:MAG: carbon monoxide dehydrogenase subunit G [Alphaproteobacteria bacterium]